MLRNGGTKEGNREYSNSHPLALFIVHIDSVYVIVRNIAYNIVQFRLYCRPRQFGRNPTGGWVTSDPVRGDLENYLGLRTSTYLFTNDAL